MGNDYKDKQDFLQKLKENYDQIEQINGGGGGVIYKAVHRRLEQKVILKKIRSDKLHAIDDYKEKMILMELKHPYLPKIVDYWSYEGEVYTGMEFIEGRSFKE